jgi:hypothetical protein
MLCVIIYAASTTLTTCTPLSSAVLSGRRAIGSLTGDNGKIGLECTAALIASQFLIAAAHCVYIPVTGYLGNLRCARAPSPASNCILSCSSRASLADTSCW